MGGWGQAVPARACSTVPGTALRRATWLSGAAALTADTAQGKGALSPSLMLPLNRGALRAGPCVDGVSPGLDVTICLRGWAALLLPRPGLPITARVCPLCPREGLGAGSPSLSASPG